MGCGNNNATEIRIRELEGYDLNQLGINLKESLILFFSKKNSLDVNIGIYTDITYIKKKGCEKIIKYKNEKFFLKSNKKKVINGSLLKRYYELYPHFINHSSVGIDDKLSPNFLLNKNFGKLFESLDIKLDKNNDNKFSICFINNNDKINDELNQIKNKYPNELFIYRNKSINDYIYTPYENYTIFFKGKEIEFWVENKYINQDNFELYLNYNENSVNDINEKKKKYIQENKEKEKEYIIKYKYYEIFDKSGEETSTKCFPLIIISPKLNNIKNNNIIIYINQEKKQKFIDFISTEINSNFTEEKIIISKIEIFKERITSFLFNTFFISKKKYTLYISSIKYQTLFNLIEFFRQNIINKKEKKYMNEIIDNIIILPEVNNKFNFYEKDKYIYILMNDSLCFNFAKTLLKKKYKDIYGNKFIKFICVTKNKNTDINLPNEEILYISEESLINKEKNNLLEFFIFSFSDINYFSHILLITNEAGIITYTNYFNNRAQIFGNYLKEKDIGIKQNLELIDINNFKEVKNFYEQKNNLLLNDIKNIYNENIININDESLFDNFYKKDIFHQPYLSLKYNKILSQPFSDDPQPQKFYKNYTLNFTNIKNKYELYLDKNEHKCLNEISYIYNENETYIKFAKDLRCKNCHYKILKNEGLEKNKYIFYLCPISKNVICNKCYQNEQQYELSYPYNLLYIKCKEKFIFNYIPKDNVLLFKERINQLNHPEIFDEKCDMCNNDLCIKNNKRKNFYIFVQIIKKNYFLICDTCFQILNSDDKDWMFNDEFEYINNFIINYFIDLDNVIFKIVKFK